MRSPCRRVDGERVSRSAQSDDSSAGLSQLDLLKRIGARGAAGMPLYPRAIRALSGPRRPAVPLPAREKVRVHRRQAGVPCERGPEMLFGIRDCGRGGPAASLPACCCGKADCVLRAGGGGRERKGRGGRCERSEARLLPLTAARCGRLALLARSRQPRRLQHRAYAATLDCEPHTRRRCRRVRSPQVLRSAHRAAGPMGCRASCRLPLCSRRAGRG